jgi:hypothetical protein
VAVKARRKRKDLVLAVGSTKDGDGAVVLRSRAQQLELAEMRPLQDGRPIQGEVVRLERRPEMPLLFDAETILEAPPAERPPAPKSAERSGPAQVASDAYRKNWDAIWRRRKAQELN